MMVVDLAEKYQEKHHFMSHFLGANPLTTINHERINLCIGRDLLMFLARSPTHSTILLALLPSTVNMMYC